MVVCVAQKNPMGWLLLSGNIFTCQQRHVTMHSFIERNDSTTRRFFGLVLLAVFSFVCLFVLILAKEHDYSKATCCRDSGASQLTYSPQSTHTESSNLNLTNPLC